jgi:hypothetical protein
MGRGEIGFEGAARTTGFAGSAGERQGLRQRQERAGSRDRLGRDRVWGRGEGGQGFMERRGGKRV